MREPANILLVEDNPADVELVRQALLERAVPAALSVAENAVQAFQILGHQGAHRAAPRPDLVILDLNLPIIHGHKVLMTMRETPAWATIPVVVFSSSRSPQDKVICHRLGCDNYMTKPTVWSDYLAMAERLKRALSEGTCASLAR